MGEFDPTRYWEERLGTPDLSTVGYQGLGLPYNRWLYRLRLKLFLREARRLRHDWEGQRVLDVGSGTGFYVSAWLRLGASVTGSDLTNASVDELLKILPRESVRRFDIADPPPFEPASFDAISAFDVLFHIVDDVRYEAALGNMATMLKEGGYLFFSENFVRGKPSMKGIHHVSRPLHSIERLLAAADLEIVVRRPMFVLMNAPLDAHTWLLRSYWSVLERTLSRVPSLGGVVGGAMYPLESLLVRVCKESPTTELTVCRKLAAR